MNSDEIFDMIEQIAATSSKNEKIALLKEGCKHADFKRMLLATYNPLTTYGMEKMPDRRVSDFGGSDTDHFFGESTWTLIEDLASRKLTGHDAWHSVEKMFDHLTEKSAELLKRILRKDMRAGFSDSSCNKACKGLIPEFPYMRCSLPKDAKFEEWNWEAGALSQEKADGMFANIDHDAFGAVRITSRQGSQFPLEAFHELVHEVKSRLQRDTQAHGELLVVKDGEILPRQIGNGMLNSVLEGGSFEEGCAPIYKVWDSIPLYAVQPKGRYEAPYRNRLRGIAIGLRDNPGSLISVIETKVVNSLSEAYQHAGDLMKKGKEGTILKKGDAYWRDGTSKDQIKLKLEFEVDLVVVAIAAGKEGTKNEGRAGALTCETSDGLLRVDVTVKNEKMRDEVDANPDEWLGKVIVVLANDIMTPSESNDLHSLFLPRMIEAAYRTDKTVADDLARVFEAKECAVLGAALKAAA